MCIRDRFRNEMNFISANENVHIPGIEETDEILNFYYSHCPNGITDVKTYKKIIYKNIYPGIDLLLYATGTSFGFKYDFIVNPGANPEDIKLNYHDSKTTLQKNGSVSIDFNNMMIIEETPYSFPENNSEKIKVHSNFVVKGTTISFNIDKYDRSKVLIIDPVINWSTYFGGSDGDHSSTIGLDNQANVVIAGNTLSKNLPVTDGTTYIGEFDIFVSKFDYTGKRLWSTYYGGKGADYVGEVAIDPAAHIYLTGWTWDKNFPVSPDCFQSTHSGGYNDGVLIKFTRSGTREWATYVGGISEEHLYGLTVDNNFNVITTGWTKSNNFPNNEIPVSPKKNFDDIVIVSFTSDGDYQWSTHLGGDSIETANDVVIDYSGNINIIGSTHSRNLTITTNAQQKFNNGQWDAVIAKYNSKGGLLYSSYLGGSQSDYGTSLGADSLNNLFVTGYTQSNDFPVSTEAFQKTKNGFLNSFITNFSPSYSIQWSTYLGGKKEDYAYGLSVDRTGNVLVTGLTNSPDFPATINAVQSSLKGVSDAYGAKFSNDGKYPFWITFYGGDSEDQGNDIAVDYYHNIYITGDTKSSDFPITDNAFQKSYAGQYDAFIFKHCATSPYTDIKISGQTTFCEGESVELDAGAGFLFYEWSNGETTQKIKVTKTGSYTVHITDTMYCDFTTTPLIINVNPKPKPKIQGNAKFCEGDSAVLSVPSGYTSWIWSTGSTDDTIVVKNDVVIILQVTDANGCTGFDTANVVKRPKPSPLIHGPNVVCVNSTNIIYYVYGKIGYSYQWYVEGGEINTGQDYFNVQVDWPTSGIGKIIVIETDNATGCTGIDTLEVDVSDHLEPRIASDKGRFVMCEGDSLVLDAGLGYDKYDWNTGSREQYITVKSAGRYIVKVEAGPDCTGYDTVDISIRPIPNPTISGDSILCENVGIKMYSAPFDPNHKYYWEVTGGSTINDDSSNTLNVIWNGAGLGRISLVQFDTLTECSGYAVYDIIITPMPMVSIAPSKDTSICDGDSLLIDAGAGFKSYYWNTGDTIQSIFVNTAGTYQVIVTNQFDCQNSDSIKVDVWPRPNKPIITSIDDTLFSTAGDSYEWYRNGSILTNINTQWFVSQDDGDYKVVHRNDNGCESESDLFSYEYIPVMGYCNILLPDSIFIKTGDTVSIPIEMVSSNLLNKIKAYNFKAEITFNGSILIPTDKSIPYQRNKNMKTIYIEGMRSDTIGTLYNLEFRAALGDSICTTVSIDTLYWDSYRDVIVSSNDCVVCLTNVCNADGNRLFLSSGELRLEQNRPNPANGITYIEFEAIEEGNHRLKLMDIYGRDILVIFNKNISSGTIGLELNTSVLPAGVYFYILETPTQIRQGKMQIIN